MGNDYKYKKGQTLEEFVKNHYFEKFPNDTEEQFLNNFELYKDLPVFKASENVHEFLDGSRDLPKLDLGDKEQKYIISSDIKPEVHWIARMCTQYYLTLAFEAMKVDLQDANVSENSLGKGTPGRIAKLWLGDNLEDTTELGSGRWNKEPMLSVFPSNDSANIITKQVDLVSCCSHHFLPFSTLDGGKAIISYRPTQYVLGISKLQRFVNWAARRFWLQEDLTEYLGKTIKKISHSEDVYVRLEGVVHGCEKYRGTNTRDGSLNTEYRSGIFNQKEYIK